MDNRMKAFCEHKRLENLDRHFRADRRRPQTILTAAMLLTKPRHEREDNIYRIERYEAKKENISAVPRIFTAKNSIIMEMVK